MGTFGTGIFENDAALDWIGSFISRKTVKKLEKALDSFEKSKDEIEAEEVLACCDVIAAIMGYPSDDLAPEIEEWSDKQRKKLGKNLIERALQAVASISKNSELSELWKETDEHKDWLKVQNKLIARLNEKPLAPGEEKARRPPILKLRGPKCGMDPKPFRISEKLPQLNQDIPGVGLPSDVIFSISQDISAKEIELVGNWISDFPDILFWITDYPKRKGLNIDTSLLKHFSFRKQLILNLETAKTMSYVECFDKLEKLNLMSSKASKPFEAIAKLPSLRELKLYECDATKIAADFLSFSELTSLHSFEMVYIRSGFQSKEGNLIQCKLNIESLPELPKALENLSMCCVSIDNLKSLEKAKALKKIDISNLRTDTKVLDLGELKNLRRFELVSISGMKEIVIPANVISLQLQNTFGLRATLPRSVDAIQAIRVAADTIIDGVHSDFNWGNLQYAVLSGKQSFMLASNFGKATGLECLDIVGGDSCNYSFTSFPKLKFINISDFEGDAELISALSYLDDLQEIELFYKLEGARKPLVEDFEPLRRLSNLERLNICAVGFQEGEERQISEMLGVKVNNRRRSKKERFLSKLEKQIQSLTSD